VRAGGGDDGGPLVVEGKREGGGEERRACAWTEQDNHQSKFLVGSSASCLLSSHLKIRVMGIYHRRFVVRKKKEKKVEKILV
jgi:hypothetical protein